MLWSGSSVSLKKPSKVVVDSKILHYTHAKRTKAWCRATIRITQESVREGDFKDPDLWRW